MDGIHPLAAGLNRALSTENPAVFSLLSERGKRTYFPVHGILSQAAEAHGARYDATIGIALEDDRTPMRLGAIADAAALPPSDVLPYVSAYGAQELRAAWRERMLRNNPSLRAEAIGMPVATAGMTHSLSIAAALLLDPGSAVSLPAPHWDNYEQVFSDAHGAVLRPFPLFEKSGGVTGFDVEGLRAALGEHAGTHRLLLNFPNNPTGYSPSVAEARAIVEIVAEAADRSDGIVTFVDDAYFGLAYEPSTQAESLFSALASLRENVLAVKIDGPTKEDFAWGLRVGFLTFGAKNLTPASAAALEAKAAGIVRGSVSSGSRLSQTLILRSLCDPRTDREKKEKFAALRERYLEATSLAHSERYRAAFEPLPCNSGYFLCLKPRDGVDAEAVRTLLLREYSTGVIATGGLLRIAFSSVPKRDLAALFEHVFVACMRLAEESGKESSAS